MKARCFKILEYALAAMLLSIYAGLALNRAGPGLFSLTPSGFQRILVGVRPSYYLCSDPGVAPKPGLPAIIFIGDRFATPERLRAFVGKFDEPVLLVWCNLLSAISDKTAVEDPVIWEAKRRQFPELLARYQQVLHFDPSRVYLTGGGFTGIYAWMLAYDKPGEYAGVVVISGVSYPPQIQKRLSSGRSVVTVFVRGEAVAPSRLAQDRETGRIIESENPHSRFLLKPGEDRRTLTNYWAENLRYVLQFRKSAI